MAVQFTHNDETLTLNISKEFTGLYRLNAMTHYTAVKPYMISAHYLMDNFQVDPNVIFYQVYTVEKGWIQISKETGEELLKHPKVIDSKVHTLNRKNVAYMSIALLGSVCLLMKFKKK